MITDMWTIISKELREFVAANGSRRGGIIGLLVILGFSIYLPLQIGAHWLTLPVAIVLFGAYIPMTMAMSVVADSFAGERERHTLETLLSTRLSDRAILFGKLGAVVAYAWGIGILGALVAAATVDVVHPNNVLFYSPVVAIATLATGLLISVLFASIGVIASLRAATVRQAQQFISYIFLAFFLIPVLAGTLLPSAIGQTVVTAIATANWTEVGLIVGGAVVAIDVILLAVNMSLFRRSRLILG